MRWTALLVFASGCLETVTLDLDPNPRARTTVVMADQFAFVFDHDVQEWDGVPLSVGRDETLFALSYSQPITVLQLEAGPIMPDAAGEREFPRPDLSQQKREQPFEDSEWTDTTELPVFKLPAYSIAKCAEAGFCLRAPTDELCSVCTSTVSKPMLLPPALPDVVPHPRHESSCAPGTAHFLNGAGCEPVGRPCPEIPPGAVTTTTALSAALGSASSTIALAPGTFLLGGALVNGRHTIRGCGADSIIRLIPGTAIFVQTGTVTLANLRLEGGHAALIVDTAGTGRLEDVSIDGVGNYGAVSVGSMWLRRVSTEGRSSGVTSLNGQATIEDVAIRDAISEGLSCHSTSMWIRGLTIGGTPSGVAGRAILMTTGCQMSMEEVLIERGRRIAIETYDPTTILRVRGLTIRDVDRPEEDGSGALIDRGGARFAEIEKVWIENVYGAGIIASDPNAVIRDVRVDRVTPSQFLPVFGIRLAHLGTKTGTSTLERAQVTGVPGAALHLERLDYRLGAGSVIASDFTASTEGSITAAVIAKSVDLHLSRAHLTEGTDGVEVTDGSMSRIEDIAIERTSRFAINLKGGTETALELTNVVIRDCSLGLRAIRAFEPPTVQPLHLRAAGIEVERCDQYGMLFQGVEAVVEAWSVEDNAVGIGIGEESQVTLRRGAVVANALGARVVPDLDLRDVLIEVRFSDNAQAIELSRP